MKSIIAITLAIVLGFASLGLSQPDTLANAVSFLLDLINVQSEQIDQVRIEQNALRAEWNEFPADGVLDEISEQEDSIGEIYDLLIGLNERLNDLEVQTPSN